jgi:NDP-sugar pyrophosphorylase family protein
MFNFPDICGDIKVAILSGGLGTRLKSVLPDRPKVLAVIKGKPFITYLLEQIQTWGIESVILCTGFMGDRVREEIGERYKNLKVSYSQEDIPLGTGGALKLALPLLDAKYILVMNGDSYININLSNFIKWHINNDYPASILLVSVEDVGRYGKVEIDGRGKILNFIEKNRRAQPGLINAGIYLFNNHILHQLPSDIPYSLEEQFFPFLVKKGLYGFQVKGEFIDIGTPESYIKAEEFFNK